MDDRDLIRERIEAKAATRDQLADALTVSVPSIGRLLRKERRLTADERDKAFRLLGIGKVVSVRTIPLLGSIAAGDWREAIEEPSGETWATEGGPNTFGLTVEGDSMDQLAPSGAKIAVDPDDRNLVAGKCYAVLNGAGESTFKRFFTDPARLEPVSSNQKHKPIIIGSDDFKIVGRVVQVVIAT